MAEHLKSAYPIYLENKAVFEAVIEQVINPGMFAEADRYFAHDYVEHVPPVPGGAGGLAGMKQFFALLRAAFPDLHYAIEEPLLADGDRVVGRCTVRGTMKGAFLGMPATGKTATWTEIHAARVVDGKIVEHWAVGDRLGMLQQLGLAPEPGK
jgi:steroid delta-isomerase-like uncharacterized protein